MQTLKEKYNKEVVGALKKKFGYKNDMAVPKILKVSLETGLGTQKDDARKEVIRKGLVVIAGQKPKVNAAKKAIASFKSRIGMPIGYSVTLRGDRMYDFLEKFINIAIPRIRDFRGLSDKLIDTNGNMAVGIKEHIVFPETGKDDVRQAFGLGVTIVTSAKNKAEAFELLKLLGMPFAK